MARGRVTRDHKKLCEHGLPRIPPQPEIRRMSSQGADAKEIAEIARWFADDGWELRIWREADDLFWAELTARASGFVVQKYGRGVSEVDAARRAKQRLITEG